MKIKKTKIIIVISVIIALAILLIISLKNNGILTKQQNQQLADVGYITQIGDNQYDITDKIENDIIPTLSAGMIPIKWNNGYWEITTKDNWCDYGNGQPAYMMLNDRTYQSEEYYQMPNSKKLAEDNIGTQIQPSDLGSIYMWVPRYAYNEDGDIIYIKQTSSVAGTWTMPNVFLYETEVVDYALAGIWVECNTLGETELTSKIEEMNTKDSQYGFIANTKINAMTEDEQEAIQRIIENLSANNVGGSALDEPLVEDITNINHLVIRIFNTNILEPTKAEVYLDDDGDNVILKIIYNENPIEIVLNENKIKLTETSDKTYLQEVYSATYEYIIVDNQENMKQIKIKDVYPIRNEQELTEFRNSVNAGNNFAGEIVLQLADIDMSNVCGSRVDTDGDGIGDTEVSWIPIGATRKYFAGTYNGGYHNLNNLYINSSQYECQGMFYTLPVGSKVKNIIMTNVYIYNIFENGVRCGYTGGIAGAVDGTIEQCGIESGNIIDIRTYTGAIRSAFCGGVAGILWDNAKIDKCYNKANCNGEANEDPNVGGIAGYICNNSEISNCYNTGKISAKGKNLCIGGIAGSEYYQNGLKITNCYNIGPLLGTGTSNTYTGGVFGWKPGGTLTITNSYCLSTATHGATQVAATTLKTYASTLGNAYKDDSYNLNEEYPILEWQLNVPIYANAYLNDDGDKIEVKILYNKNGIKEVSDENNNLLNEITKNEIYSIDITNGKHKFKVIDEKENIIQLSLNIKFINNVYDLNNLRDEVNTGEYLNVGVTAIQTADIDMSEQCSETIGSWTPIGISGDYYFSGTYYGRNHKISNLYINEQDKYYVGLFGYIKEAEIYDINLFGNIIGQDCVGGICGYAKDKIKIINCTNNANVTATNASVGGFIGCTGNLTNSYIINCTNNATIVANSHNASGICGIIGNRSIITINQCSNIGNITAKQNISGGIVGVIQNNSTANIDKCCNFGKIYATGVCAGGGVANIINGSKLFISNCYNRGEIGTGTGSHAGILGNLDLYDSSYGSPYATITNCYNAGTIARVGAYGGIVGWTKNGSWYTLSNNYWETGKGANYGAWSGNSNTGATPVSAATLKNYASRLGDAYTDDITPNINNGYPILKWQIEE